jgi:hypothetical protein
MKWLWPRRDTIPETVWGTEEKYGNLNQVNHVPAKFQMEPLSDTSLESCL